MSAEIRETRDIATCLNIRRVVFTEEQGVSVEDDVDGRDDEALHLLAVKNGVPVGTARMLLSGTTGKIGRVAVLKSERGTGLGKALIEAACDLLKKRGLETAKLAAQTHAIGFYEALGFVARGPEFDDAGIPHREMVRDL